MSKTLFLVRGLPGAGKSSFIESLLDMGLDIRAYATDDWLKDFDGSYRWEAEKLREAHNQCQASVEWDMSDDFDNIAVHNTLTTETELEPYLTLAKKYGYKVVSLIVENRHGNKNIHQVPESTIIKMRNRFSVKL